MNEREMHLLVVEDDDAIRTALFEKLTLEGYRVSVAIDGEAALETLAVATPDLVVLDLMLPRLDGLSVLRALRKRWPSLPVLILSAKGRESEKVEGLRAGADDYLVKPFGVAELLARIEALLRRSRAPVEAVGFGDVAIDPIRRQVSRGGREVVLSKTELELLLFLARHKGSVVSREQILDAVWGPYSGSADRAVDYHVLNLRKKLEPDPASPQHILTRHGLGYMLVT